MAPLSLPSIALREWIIDKRNVGRELQKLTLENTMNNFDFSEPRTFFNSPARGIRMEWRTLREDSKQAIKQLQEEVTEVTVAVIRKHLDKGWIRIISDDGLILRNEQIWPQEDEDYY